MSSYGTSARRCTAAPATTGRTSAGSCCARSCTRTEGERPTMHRSMDDPGERAATAKHPDPKVRNPDYLKASRWRRRPQPERACLADLLEKRAALCRPLREPGGEIVRIEHMVSRLGAEKPRELGEADEALLGPGVELLPASSVLFRPEEVQARSAKRL